MEGIWINPTIVQRECKCRNGVQRVRCSFKSLCPFAWILMFVYRMSTCLCVCRFFSSHAHLCLYSIYDVCMCACACLLHLCMHACVCILCLHTYLCLYIISLDVCSIAFHIFGRLYRKLHSSGYFGKETGELEWRLRFSSLFFIHLTFLSGK